MNKTFCFYIFQVIRIKDNSNSTNLVYIEKVNINE